MFTGQEAQEDKQYGDMPYYFQIINNGNSLSLSRSRSQFVS